MLNHWLAGGAFAQWPRLVGRHAPDVAWVLRGRLAKRHRPPPLSQARPLRHPACPRPGSRPARDASRSRLHRGATTCSAELCHRHSRLCYSSARPGVSLHCRRMAKLSKAKPSHFVALPCFAIAMHRVGSPSHSLAPPSDAAPLRRIVARCFAVAGYCISKPPHIRSRLCAAVPSPCLAVLGFAFALPRFALLSPGPAHQSNAFAARISPSPLHAAALLRHSRAILRLAIAARCATRLRRRHSKPVPAGLFHASAYRSVAGPSRVRAFPCPSLANRPYAVPSPWRRIALLFPCSARHRSAYHSPI